ncbi:MAG: hypothetical protein QXQ53_09310 [Candidatus Methanosuratincola sp.]
MKAQHDLDGVQPTGQCFCYKVTDAAIFYILALVSSILALILLTDLVVSIVGGISGDNVRIAELLTTTGYILLLVFYSLVISSPYPNFCTSDSGLIVKVFLFWQVFVPWDKVHDIRDTLLGFSKIVVLQELTPIHRVYGMIFGLTFRPAFVIRRRINGYDKAVRIIEERAGKQ